MEHDHRRIDRCVHFVLRAGMILSISVLAVGLLLYVLSPGGGGESGMSLDMMIDGLLRGDPVAVMNLGILLLIATPLTRVVTAAAVFIVDREPRFALVSFIVIAAIALAIAVG
jgi:uncharacterized membrane protein